MPRASQPRVRLGLIVGILLFCGVVVVARAAYMQLINDDRLQAAGDERFLREVTIATTRDIQTEAAALDQVIDAACRQIEKLSGEWAE